MKKSNLSEAFKSLEKKIVENGMEITSPNSILGGRCKNQTVNCNGSYSSCDKQGNTTTTTISTTVLSNQKLINQ